MRYGTLTTLVTSMLVFGLAACSRTPEEPAARRIAPATAGADTVSTNGKTYTAAADHPRAEAIAARGTTIVRVGEAGNADASVGEATRVEDLSGKFMMPAIMAGTAPATVHAGT